MHVYMDNKLQLSGVKCNNMYVLNASYCNFVVASLSALSVVDKFDVIWQRSLGHLSSQNIGILHNLGLLGKLKNTDLRFCETCVLAKKHRHSFSTSQHTTKSIFDLHVSF